MKRMRGWLEDQPFWVGLVSLFLLFLGMMAFDASVARDRLASELLANLAPNGESAFITGAMRPLGNSGYAQVFDLSGGVARFKNPFPRLEEKPFVILKGSLDSERLFQVEAFEEHSLMRWKFGLSGLALAFLFGILVRSLRLGPKGCRLEEFE